jgi:hypothetical protein
MATRDLNILGLKINTSNNKKDISFVSDYNSYVQKIENVCRLQKNEIPSAMNMGVDYYVFLFNPVSNKNTMEQSIANSIINSISELEDVSVDITYYTESLITMNVTFTVSKLIQKNPTTCKIEVTLV